MFAIVKQLALLSSITRNSLTSWNENDRPSLTSNPVRLTARSDAAHTDRGRQSAQRSQVGPSRTRAPIPDARVRSIRPGFTVVAARSASLPPHGTAIASVVRDRVRHRVRAIWDP